MSKFLGVFIGPSRSPAEHKSVIHMGPFEAEMQPSPETVKTIWKPFSPDPAVNKAPGTPYIPISPRPSGKNINKIPRPDLDPRPARKRKRTSIQVAIPSARATCHSCRAKSARQMVRLCVLCDKIQICETCMARHYLKMEPWKSAAPSDDFSCPQCLHKCVCIGCRRKRNEASPIKHGRYRNKDKITIKIPAAALKTPHRPTPPSDDSDSASDIDAPVSLSRRTTFVTSPGTVLPSPPRLTLHPENQESGAPICICQQTTSADFVSPAKTQLSAPSRQAPVCTCPQIHPPSTPKSLHSSPSTLQRFFIRANSADNAHLFLSAALSPHSLLQSSPAPSRELTPSIALMIEEGTPELQQHGEDSASSSSASTVHTPPSADTFSPLEPLFESNGMGKMDTAMFWEGLGLLA